MIEEIVKLNDQILPQLQANVAEQEEISDQGELSIESCHRFHKLEQQRNKKPNLIQTISQGS